MDARGREFIQELFLKQEERLQKQLKEIQHSMDLMVNHFDKKFDLVIDGQQALAERMDRIVVKYDGEIGQFDKRLDTRRG